MSPNKAIVENAALTWFREHGYAIGGSLTARPIGLPVLRPEQANRAFDAANQVACEKRTDRGSGAKMFSMTPKNKRPRQSPEPVADRESPAHGRNPTGYDTAKQRGHSLFHAKPLPQSDPIFCQTEAATIKPYLMVRTEDLQQVGRATIPDSRIVEDSIRSETKP